MNPPMPNSVCKEEMQSATIDNNNIFIEYITDAQERKIKKLKPLLIKMEPDREYIQHVQSDDNLPKVAKDNFFTKEMEQSISIAKPFLLIPQVIIVP